jgi:23S rRNA pseudouridine1911/1915/1917 synthase
MKFYDREIIHCDNHLLVAVKRSGEVVQPDLHEEMRSWVAQHFNKVGPAFLEPVHRLDRPVSGLVLFARTSKALQRLHASLRKREIRKIYLARVEGYVEREEGVLTHFLRHGSFRAEVVTRQDPRGKEAVLSYKVLERNQESSLLEIELQTGRYHQIRAQLAEIGHPILGDRKYGSRFYKESIALHHKQLELHHPVTREKLLFSIGDLGDKGEIC